MKPRLTRIGFVRPVESRNHIANAPLSSEKATSMANAKTKDVETRSFCSICRISQRKQSSSLKLTLSVVGRPQLRHRHSSMNNQLSFQSQNLSHVKQPSETDSAYTHHLLSSKILRRTVAGCGENYARSIDNIIEQKLSKDLIDYQEITCNSDVTLFSRYYRSYEFPTKLQTLYKFCKFVIVFPKLYNLAVFKIIRKYIHLKRRKREKTMRRILEEIDDSNMNMLSLDYVLFCESTCSPVTLTQFTKTKLAIRNANRLGWICLNNNETSAGILSDLLRVPSEKETKADPWPFDTEQSTILQGNIQKAENNSFADSAFVGETRDSRYDKPSNKGSFNYRKSDLRMSQFIAKKPVKNVYVNFKKEDKDARKLTFGNAMKPSIYIKRQSAKFSYRTKSENETVQPAVSRKSNAPEAVLSEHQKAHSQREINIRSSKLALSTNKLMIGSHKTIHVRKFNKQGHSSGTNGENTPAKNETPAAGSPKTGYTVPRKKHPSFKGHLQMVTHRATLESNSGSVYAVSSNKVSSERSIKFPSERKGPINKRSIDEYNVKTGHPATENPHKEEAERKVLGEKEGCTPVVQVISPMDTEKTLKTDVLSRKKTSPTKEPTSGKSLREIKLLQFKPHLKIKTDSLVKQAIKTRGLLKLKPFNPQEKGTKINLSSTFQLICKRPSVLQNKQSFAEKRIKTHFELDEVGEVEDKDDGSCKLSVEPRKHDSKLKTNRLMNALLFKNV